MTLRSLCSFAANVLTCGGSADGTPRRFRLPSFGWRLVTIITLAALIGSDPAFNGLWNAQAACTIPSNASTLTTRITTFTYDVEGRLAQVNSPEGVVNYDYDLITGRHVGSCTQNSETTYEYDALGRLWKVRGTVATVGFPNIGLQGFAPKLAKGEIASLSGLRRAAVVSHRNSSRGTDSKLIAREEAASSTQAGGALVDERGNVVGVVSAKLNPESFRGCGRAGRFRRM